MQRLSSIVTFYIDTSPDFRDRTKRAQLRVLRNRSSLCGVFDAIRTRHVGISVSRVSVLLCGQQGTGKPIIAEMLESRYSFVEVGVINLPYWGGPPEEAYLRASQRRMGARRLVTMVDVVVLVWREECDTFMRIIKNRYGPLSGRLCRFA